VRPVSRYVARFIGSPQIDLIEGEAVIADHGSGFRVGGALISLPRATAEALGRLGPLELGIRPEHVVLSEQGLDAIVEIVQPVGPASFVGLRWPGGLLTARVPGMSRLKAGEAVHFFVEPEQMMFFDKASGRRVLASPSRPEE